VLGRFLHKLLRDPQVRRFKSFGKTAVYESEIMAGLIALSAFTEQTRQVDRRPQFERERGLRFCNRKRFGQAIRGRIPAMLRHGHQNQRFNS
jgi:hypothetical protein